MKPFILTLIASASLSVLGSAAWAQEHDHGAMSQGAAGAMPTMEDCRSMRHDMMASHATDDSATDATAMAGMADMPDVMRERMMQCHSMMEAAQGDQTDAMHHDGAGAMHEHEPAAEADEADHDHGEASQPH